MSFAATIQKLWLTLSVVAFVCHQYGSQKSRGRKDQQVDFIGKSSAVSGRFKRASLNNQKEPVS